MAPYFVVHIKLKQGSNQCSVKLSATFNNDNYTQDTQSAWFYSLKVSQTLSTDSFGTGFTVSWRGNFCDSAERLFRGVLESKQQNLPLQHLWSPPVTQQSGGSVLDRTVDGRAYGVQALLPIYTSCTWALDTFQEPKGISENVWKKERKTIPCGRFCLTVE